MPKTFTYRVSEAEFQYIQKGMRIAVPFGKNKIYTALAVDLHQNAPTLYEAKEIHQILDEQPIVNEFQINHCTIQPEFGKTCTKDYIIQE